VGSALRSSDPYIMNCSHVDMCTPHAMWGPERAITPSISRDLMEEDVPVLRESTVREPSDHALIHTGEKARPSRTPQPHPSLSRQDQPRSTVSQPFSGFTLRRPSHPTSFYQGRDHRVASSSAVLRLI